MLDIAVPVALADVVDYMRQQVGQHRNYALGTQRKGRGNLVVVAAVDVQPVAAAGGNLSHLGNAAAGFFDTDDVFHLAKPHTGVRLDIHAGAGGNIIEDNRQIGRLGTGFEMLIESLLGGLIVVGGYV